MSKDVFRPVRLRDAPILKALEQFGQLYGQAVEIKVAAMQERLSRIVQLANTKATDLSRNNDDTFHRAQAVSHQAKVNLDAHMRELKEGKSK